MAAGAGLTAELREQVSLLEVDLRARVEGQPEVLGQWRAEHAAASRRERTAATWSTWRDQRVTQAAVGWVLTTVFVRFCEDNSLIAPVWIAGPGSRRQEALDAQLAFFRANPELTDREWIGEPITYFASLPATRELVDQRSALHLVSPSGDAAAALLAFWRERDDAGVPLRDLTDPEWSTRFLGDIYQDISAAARSTYALLQTPEFVEEFILDRTMEPALADRALDGFSMIDPTCGSGHFLLGAFARLLDRWERHAPGMDRRVRVQAALDAVHGVDINPFAVAIARFRLTLAALRASDLHGLEVAPAFDYHLVVGDSLWFGAGQQAMDFDDDDQAGLGGFAYSWEDRVTLRDLLTPGRYDAVVGNPPYIVVRDAALNAAYRRFYPSCRGKYAMTIPFMELFFNLAVTSSDLRSAGWVGQITSNSFMKREFGSKLIEAFLPTQDLRLVADTSGAYIPGHGTPTVIIVGRHRRPVGTTVRAVLGIRGEPGRPEDPAKAIVWRSIVDHVDEPGHDDGWTSTADLDRGLLNRHPWSLAGGGAVELRERIATGATHPMGELIHRAGFFGITGEDDAMTVPHMLVIRDRLEAPVYRRLAFGEDVRDYSVDPDIDTFFPYNGHHALVALSTIPRASAQMWPNRTVLSNRATFAGQTYLAAGRPWFAWHQLPIDRMASRYSISWGSVATHNHFALDRQSTAFTQSAPVIKLPEGASEDDHLGLLGVLNSSTACFWLKQVSHNKGGPGGGSSKDEKWRDFYEFTGSDLKDFPLPGRLPTERARAIDSYAAELAALSPESVVQKTLPTRAGLDHAHDEYRNVRARMIAEQEELDWEVYRLYGLVDEDLVTDQVPVPGLAVGERSFEIRMAREQDRAKLTTRWFDDFSQTRITVAPETWPENYRSIVSRRVGLIDSYAGLQLLENPNCKRTWATEPWEKREERAIRDWLLDRLEDRRFWYDPQDRPVTLSIGQLADQVSRDPDLVSVLALREGRPDIAVTTSLVSLLANEAVPFLAAYRYKDTGLRKRADWETTWALQRCEDAGEELADPIPVPPKYTNADFTKTAYWQARGKLDVPKERFILYRDAGRDTDPTPVIGWAGWDHAQQALALNALIAQRIQDGWADARLVPLVAGLAELQPWIDQWHADIDPTYNVSLAAFCREQLDTLAQRVGMTLDELAAWRPEKRTRGRRPRTVGGNR